MTTGRAASSKAAFGARGIALLVLFALVVRLALPAGTMLERPAGDDDAPRIVLCTAAGMIEIATPGDFGVPAQKDRDAPSDGNARPCPYSVNTVQVTVPPSVLVARYRSTFVLAAGGRLERLGAAIARIAMAPPSTGPPIPV